MPQPFNPVSSYCMAVAIFDNVPDSPDELSFRKGDVLNVVQQNYSNIEGWYLCLFNGRKGICPANRLQLLTDIYDVPQNDHNNSRGSYQEQVFNSKRHNEDIVCYDMPNRFSPLPAQTTNAIRQPTANTDYDVPPTRHVNTGASPNCLRCTSASPQCVSPISRDGDAYDVPRPLNSSHHHPNQLTPSSSASSLTADSISSSNRSSFLNMISDYDVPKSHSKGPQLVLQPHQYYDVPPSSHGGSKELPLELNAALESLQRLENETALSIKTILGFVGSGWRSKDKLIETISDIKSAVYRLRCSLNSLAEFGEGTLGNATKASDKNLAGKLAPLVSCLRKSSFTVNDSTDKLNHLNWSIDALAISDDREDHYEPDALDTLVACSKALTEDIRQITSFIQGNGLLLFKREPENDWANEYDYLQLSGDDKTATTKNNCAIDNHETIDLPFEDRQALAILAAQYLMQHKNLMLAIDAFLDTLKRNQPPKVFLAYAKNVVLVGHKLVYIGDTVARNLSSKEVKERVSQGANALSDVLAQNVAKTKQAALQFPAGTAVQEMVDSVLEVSHAANGLKMCLLQPAATFL